jgi:hypothetical protein
MTADHRTLHPLRNVRLAAVVLMLLTVSACSTRFFYNRIDWFVVWKLGDYVTLTDVQKADLKADLNDHLEYVRVNEMPRVVEVLNKTAREVESGYITADMMDARYNELLVIYDDFMLGIVPLSMRFLRGLDDEQVQELFEKFEEVNQEMYEEYSGRTSEERKKNRNKSAVKSTENWTGRLSSEQRQILKDALARMSDSSEQWITYQREWQRRFRILIAERPPEDEYLEELTQLFVSPRDLHSRSYRDQVDANRTILNVALAELLNGLTDKQRKRSVKKLDGYAKDLTKLSQSPRSP